MSNITGKLWKKYWGKNIDIDNSNTLDLIDSYLKPVSDSDKENLLRQPISTFRSVSILFRWIYFNLFKMMRLSRKLLSL